MRGHTEATRNRIEGLVRRVKEGVRKRANYKLEPANIPGGYRIVETDEEPDIDALIFETHEEAMRAKRSFGKVIGTNQGLGELVDKIKRKATKAVGAPGSPNVTVSVQNLFETYVGNLESKRGPDYFRAEVLGGGRKEVRHAGTARVKTRLTGYSGDGGL